MSSARASQVTPIYGRVLEDTIDGYFPLRVSLSHLMDRHDLASALISLSHAPMAAFPDLPDDAPVPLDIRSGRPGLIDAAVLWCRRSGTVVEVSGRAAWRWLDAAGPGRHLDPMTRLAEPAFVHGIGLGADRSDDDLESVSVDLPEAGAAILRETVERLGWPGARIWGPLPREGGIEPFGRAERSVFGVSVARGAPPDLVAGSYVLSRVDTPV